MPQILSGYRVLDFGRFISGPFCAALLADLGAEVVRVEPATGADDRQVMPIATGRDGAMHLHVNRNKKSLTLELGHPASRPVLERLIRSADVVVANTPPAALQKLGLDYATLKSLREDIILTSISAYGHDGAFRDMVGFDGTGQALSGAIYLTGTPQQPYRSAVSYVDYGTALAAALGTVAALLQRERTGRGEHVQSSLLGTALTLTNPMLIEEATGARSRVATGNRSPIAGPSDMFATRDGWIMIQVIGQAMFQRWAQLLGAEDLLADPRFVDDQARGDNGAELSARTAMWTMDKSTAECLDLLRRHRLPATPVLAPNETLGATEVKEGGFLRYVQHPEFATPIPVVAPPVSFGGSVGGDPHPAPPLGADTSSLLADLGFTSNDVDELRRLGAV